MDLLKGLDLFSGLGGITYGLQDYIRPLAYCEIDPYCQSVLLSRMQEGDLPKAPIWEDINTFRDALFDSGLIYSTIDIIYGGSPCQDISVAGLRKGLEGERSGLIFKVFEILDEVKAPFLFLENVPNIRTKGAERICKELAERGYDCRWCCLSAGDVGAPHKRERWFLLAYAEHLGSYGTEELRSAKKSVFNASKREDAAEQFEGVDISQPLASKSSAYSTSNGKRRLPGREKKEGSFHRMRFDARNWKEVKPPVCGMDDGIPHRMGKLKALGNAVVPLQVKTAFEILIHRSKGGRGTKPRIFLRACTTA